MPYAIRKVGKKWSVVNTSTGKTKGTHSSRAGAQRQVNLLRGVEHGWEPTGKKANPSRSKGKAKRTVKRKKNTQTRKRKK